MWERTNKRRKYRKQQTHTHKKEKEKEILCSLLLILFFFFCSSLLFSSSDWLDSTRELSIFYCEYFASYAVLCYNYKSHIYIERHTHILRHYYQCPLPTNELTERTKRTDPLWCRRKRFLCCCSSVCARVFVIYFSLHKIEEKKTTKHLRKIHTRHSCSWQIKRWKTKEAAAATSTKLVITIFIIILYHIVTAR